MGLEENFANIKPYGYGDDSEQVGIKYGAAKKFIICFSVAAYHDEGYGARHRGLEKDKKFIGHIKRAISQHDQNKHRKRY